MESHRLERQRRDSAKMSAAETLPSTQDQEFHFRLIGLYEQYPCLWNTMLREHEDAELKREAWEQISKQLGAHLSPSFVRSRISSMRYRLNVYKLQLLEYRMSPASCRKPEKLYYIDKFAFLDEVQRPHPENATEPANRGPITSPSIASIFKQRVVQQQHLDELPDVLQRLSQSSRHRADLTDQEPQNSPGLSIANVIRQRLDAGTFTQKKSISTNSEPLLGITKPRQPALQPQTFSMESPRSNAAPAIEAIPDYLNDFRCAQIDIPSVVKKRMRQQLQYGMPHGLFQAKIKGIGLAEASKLAAPAAPATPAASAAPLAPSPLSAPDTSCTLRAAMPGDSVSKTKVNERQKAYPSDEQLSDEEELYRLHWEQRKQQRSRRPSVLTTAPRNLLSQPVPPLLLGRPLSSSSDGQLEDALDNSI